MQKLTDDEMLNILARCPASERRVQMSTDGIFLHVGGEAYEIDFPQADALFTTMFGHGKA